MTACGHHFCKLCIQECLNRKHNCPCCNTAAVASELVPNIHFDRIIEVIRTERALAQQKYLQSLATNAPSESSSSEASSASSVRTVSPFSPIERTFMKNMQASLSVYEDYFRSLEAKLIRSVGLLEEEYAKKMADLAAQSASPASSSESFLEMGSQIELLRTQCRQEIDAMEASFQSSFTALAQSYDEYLKKSTVLPKILPIKVDISLEAEGLHFRAIVLKPTDSLADVKRLIEQRCEAQDLALAKFTPSNTFFFRRPFIFNEISGTREIPITDEHGPILELLAFEAEPGCAIVMRGPLALKSNTVEPCFTTAPFEKGVSKTDYFTCKTCNLNWICRGCHISCHKSKGHETVPYLMNNTPTWKCCYCAKKKICST